MNRQTAQRGPRQGKPTLFYRVTATFGDGSVTNDVALEHNDINAARSYATSKFAEHAVPPVKIELKRISRAEAGAIVDAGGVDWLRQSI